MSTSRAITLWFLLALYIAPVSAIGTASAFELPDWQSPLEQDSPVTGTLFNTQGNTAARTDMIAAMAAADHVLLGEIHDNPDHHAIQAAVIEALVHAGRQPAIVLEMVPRSLQPEIDAFMAGDAPDAAAFGAAVMWERRGWPDWRLYQPIMEVALDNGIPVYAGNLDRGRVCDVAMGGLEALSEGERANYVMTRDIAASGRSALDDALFEGHCGLMPRERLAPMALAQKMRDGAMARTMLEATTKGAAPVVLIAGGGHARHDFGVPTALAEIDPGARIIALSMAEALAGNDKPSDYVTAGSHVFDFVLVTPRAERDDPCEGLAERMGIKRP